MMIKLSTVTREQIGYDVPMSTFRRWVATGLFPGTKVGGRWFVSEEKLAEFRSGWVPPETEQRRIWHDLRALALKRGLIGAPSDDRQITLPLDTTPTIPAGALDNLRDPLGPDAPDWVKALATAVSDGLRSDQAEALLAWMKGQDEAPPETPAAPPDDEQRLLRDITNAPEKIRLIYEMFEAGDPVSDAEFTEMMTYLKSEPR